MGSIVQGRQMAEIDGDFVVFLIGARVSPLHPIRSLRDLGGIRRGMPGMLAGLARHPEKGLLAFTIGYPVIVQYWRSFEHLEAFASDEHDPHAAVWRDYFRRARRHRGAGIWHETFLVRAGDYETAYVNMPPFGLARAGRMVPMAEASTSRLRLRSRGRA